MDGRLVQTSCRTTHFSAVEATLRDWPEVEAVGSFREKKNNKRDITTVFVTFRDEAAAKAAKAKLEAIPGIAEATTVLSVSPEPEKAVASGSRSKLSRRTRGNARSDKRSLAAEFLSFESYGDQKKRDAQTKKRSNGARGEAGEGTARRGGSGRGERGGSRANENNHGRGTSGMRGRSGAHLQSPQSFHQPQQYQEHQLHLQPYQPPPPPPRLPPFEANVAFIDNVPFGTTNSHLMKHFSAFGRILDVNRLELMVMICFDNPESVQQCIQHMNGTKIHDNVITVSSGTVRIPGSIALRMGA